MTQLGRAVFLQVWAAIWIVACGVDGFARLSSDGAAVKLGKCPQASSIKNFDINSFEGEWFLAYQLSRKFSPCTTFSFTVTSKMSFDIETSTQVGETKSISVRAKAFSANATNPGVMNWSWDLFPGFADQMTVVDTDYDDYAVLFFCTDFGFIHHEAGVVFTRTESDLPELYIKRAQKLLSDFFPLSSGTEVEECKYNVFGYSNETKTTAATTTLSLDNTLREVFNVLKAALGFGH